MEKKIEVECMRAIREPLPKDEKGNRPDGQPPEKLLFNGADGFAMSVCCDTPGTFVPGKKYTLVINIIE